MDTTKTVTHISLCAGYGGIDLGLRGAIPNLRTVALCEIEAFACANLVAKMEAGLMDAAPIWTNLKTFPWSEFRDRVDILSGGYPCQPFSAAGKRLGTEDPRHLWPFIAIGIRAMRPRVCFFENVEGHISLGLREVISELESIGYKAAWGIFSAREVGAPHQRKRVFILAYRASERGEGESLSRWISQGHANLADHRSDQAWPSRPGEPQHGWEPPRVVANAASQRTNDGQQLCGEECGQGRALPLQSDDSDQGVGDTESRMPRQSNAGNWREGAGGASEAGKLGNAAGNGSHQRSEETRGHADWSSNPEQQEQWQAKPSLGRDADGPASRMDYAELSFSCDNRTDELRLLGNGVVPATATLAFQTLLSQLLTL